MPQVKELAYISKIEDIFSGSQWAIFNNDGIYSDDGYPECGSSYHPIIGMTVYKTSEALQKAIEYHVAQGKMNTIKVFQMLEVNIEVKTSIKLS